jgi:hypothetical protein
MNVEIYFQKNLKYITLIILALFFIKSFQSCNRNMSIRKLTKENTYLVDSLNVMHSTEKTQLIIELGEAKDSIQELNYEVKLAKNKEIQANKRADAVQSTAEKIRENTTIKIENKSRTDTVSIDSTNRK